MKHLTLPKYFKQLPKTIPVGVVVLVMMMLFSCGKGEKPRATFYPLDSLIDRQTEILKKSRASLQKTASLGDKEDVKNFSPSRNAGDTIHWTHELSVFKELNIINKPANEGDYIVDKDLTDIRSNLKVKVFTAKNPDSTKTGAVLPVKYLRIYYHESIENLRRIEAEMDIETSLYGSARFLEMEFENINDTVVLTGYGVRGGQKIYLGDTVQYAVQGVITIPN